MRRNFFDPHWEHDPAWEQTNIVLIDSATLRKAEQQILSCEGCNRKDAHIPFEWVLDWVSGNNMIVTDYVLVEPPRCPRCEGTVKENTLVQWTDLES